MKNKLIIYILAKMVMTFLGVIFHKTHFCAYFGIYTFVFSAALGLNDTVSRVLPIMLLALSLVWIVALIFLIALKERRITVVCCTVAGLSLIDIICILCSNIDVPPVIWVLRLLGIAINSLCIFYIVRSIKRKSDNVKLNR